MMEFNQNNVDKTMIASALRGVFNNLPSQYWPYPNEDAITKRNIFKRMGYDRPSGIFSADLPIVKLSKEYHQSILRYARKIAVALFYKETETVPALNYVIASSWAQAIDLSAQERLEMLKAMLPNVTIGKRSNLDFGDRFGFRSSVSRDRKTAAFFVQFGQGLVLSTLVSDPEVLPSAAMSPHSTIAELFNGRPNHRS